MTWDKDEFIAFRLQEAKDSLRAAKVLLVEGLYRESINRSYYAMFYSVLALLVRSKIVTSKHSGAIAAFDVEYVKSGIFTKELSHWYHRAFELRQRADYKEFEPVDEVVANTIYDHATIFVAEVMNRFEGSS